MLHAWFPHWFVAHARYWPLVRLICGLDRLPCWKLMGALGRRKRGRTPLFARRLSRISLGKGDSSRSFDRKTDSDLPYVESSLDGYDGQEIEDRSNP